MDITTNSHIMHVKVFKNRMSENAYRFHSHLAQDVFSQWGYHEHEGQFVLRRYLIPFTAFLLGSGAIAGLYFGILIVAQGRESVLSIFLPNRWYVIPIWVTFGIQAALYSILRFRLFIPSTASGASGALTPVKGVMGTSGGTSLTAMAACCLHHVTDVLPILGLSAAATFLTRYQRPFMLVGLGMNILGTIAMLVVLYREYRKIYPQQKLEAVLETE